MASKYGIMTEAELDNLIDYDLTSFKDNAGTTRIYPTAFIEAKISHSERFIFGYIHKTYTLTLVPINVKWAIDEMARIYMVNQLIKDNYITNFTAYNEMDYFKANVQFMIDNEEQNGAVADAIGVDDYEVY